MRLSDAWLDQIALEAARAVEVELARGHKGGRTQRQAALQVIIRNTIRMALMKSEREGV